MVEILALVLRHDEQAVLAAVELALAVAGFRADEDPYSECAAPAGRRQADRPTSREAAQRPDAHHRPQANVARYDALRKAPEARHAS